MAELSATSPVVVRFVSGTKIPYWGHLMRLRVEPSDSMLIEVSYRNGFVVRCPRAVPEAAHDDLIEDALSTLR